MGEVDELKKMADDLEGKKEGVEITDWASAETQLRNLLGKLQSLFADDSNWAEQSRFVELDFEEAIVIAESEHPDKVRLLDHIWSRASNFFSAQRREWGALEQEYQHALKKIFEK